MKTGTRRGSSFGRLVAPVVLGAVLACAGAVSAQPQSQPTAPTLLRPPSSNTTSKPPKYRMYLTVLLIGGLMLGANAIPSKRGHQD